MRAYIFGSGLFATITSGMSLLRSVRGGEPFTWRTAMLLASWGISLALAIGAIVDTKRANAGQAVPPESPLVSKEQKQLRKRLRG
ncbi:hypothetical protein [Microbacterium sp.]|uniref:hypothetical protein n=1 Tax=Microbacterium sp. TaxID=51671 RepID=UPI0039E67531